MCYHSLIDRKGRWKCLWSDVHCIESVFSPEPNTDYHSDDQPPGFSDNSSFSLGSGLDDKTIRRAFIRKVRDNQDDKRLQIRTSSKLELKKKYELKIKWLYMHLYSHHNNQTKWLQNIFKEQSSESTFHL